MATPNLGFQNWYSSTLSSGITASDTTIYLNSLPTPSEGYLVIEPDSTTNREIIYYTSKGANFVTLPSVGAGRGAGGTTAVSHSSGVTVQMNVVAEHLESLQDGTAFAADTFNPSQVVGSDEWITNYVASGCVWTADAAGSTRVASMTSGVVYIAGKRLTVSSVTSRTFTASKDVYVDLVDNGDGTAVPVYYDNTTNAASPSFGTTGGTMRIAIVVVGASSIAAAASINQGQHDRVLPIASSVAYTVTDSLGNLICNRNPNPTLIGYRQITGNITTTSATAAQATGLSCPVIVPTGRKVRVSFVTPNLGNNTANTNNFTTIWDGTVGSGTQLTSAVWTQVSGVTNYNMANIASAITTPSSSGKTYNAGIHTPGGTTMTVSASSTSPAYISVELV